MSGPIRIRRLLLPAALSILVSCGGGVSPTNQSSRVQIAHERDISGCQFLGDVHGFNPWGGVFAAPAYRQARANAIEQAEKLRATHVVWTNLGSTQTIGGLEAHGVAYRCSAESAKMSPGVARGYSPGVAVRNETGNTQNVDPTVPRSADEIWNKEAAAAAYLDAHAEAVKRDLYEYNRGHRLTQPVGSYPNYVLHDTEVLGLADDDVMVKVSFDYGTRWNSRFASKIVRMRWMGPDLKIVDHK